MKIDIALFLSVFYLGCFRFSEVDMAKRSFNSWLSAFCAGDYDKALSYYTEEMRPKIDPEKQAPLLRTIHFTILTAEKRNSYVRLLVEMKSKEITNLKQNRWFYFIRSDNRMLMIPSNKIITKGGIITETPHFFIYSRRKPDSNAIYELEITYGETAEFLGVTPKKKIKYYWCNSREETAEVLGSAKPTSGLCIPGNISSILPNARDEVVHAVAFSLGSPIVFLMEGLATWLSYPPRDRHLFDWMVRDLIRSSQYVPLDSLLEFPEFKKYRHDITYFEAASFVKFLVDNYGIEKFRLLYQKAYNSSEFQKLIKKLYGCSLSELEKEWLNRIPGS